MSSCKPLSESNIAFGAVVQRMRVARGLALEAMATDLGLRLAEFVDIERGAHRLPIDLIFRVAELLECRPGDLVRSAEELVQVLQVSRPG